MHWIAVVDTLNFCFWSDDSVLYGVEYRGEVYTGYWSLPAAVNRALEEGIPLTDMGYLRDMTRDDAAHVFRSATGRDMPQLDVRLRNLNELGRTVCEHYEGDFAKLVRAADGSADRLVELVVEHISSYRDVSDYAGEPVYLYKRVQILVADIWACFEGHGLGKFDDIGELTMFADYRVPQCLVFLGVLAYDDELSALLERREHIPSGHAYEVEIRACSIDAVEQIRARMEAADEQVDDATGEEGEDCREDSRFPLNSIVIDFFLWTYAKEFKDDMAHCPTHRTLTQFY